MATFFDFSGRSVCNQRVLMNVIDGPFKYCFFLLFFILMGVRIMRMGIFYFWHNSNQFVCNNQYLDKNGWQFFFSAHWWRQRPMLCHFLNSKWLVNFVLSEICRRSLTSKNMKFVAGGKYVHCDADDEAPETICLFFFSSMRVKRNENSQLK